MALSSSASIRPVRIIVMNPKTGPKFRGRNSSGGRPQLEQHVWATVGWDVSMYERSNFCGTKIGKMCLAASVRTWPHAFGYTSELELESEHENTLSRGVFCEPLQYIT